MLGAGALGQPGGVIRGEGRQGGSGWGTHVYLWQIHVDVWQNQYNILGEPSEVCERRAARSSPVAHRGGAKAPSDPQAQDALPLGSAP